MKAGRRLFLLITQLALIILLAALHLYTSLPALEWLLLALLAGTAGLLILYERGYQRSLIRISGELRQVAAGNWRLRLLAKEDPAWNEILFTINELIAQLEAVQIEAFRSEAARKRLLSGISHDIRTPLTSIIGYVDALKDGLAATKEEQREYFDILSRKSNGLKELIENMFTMARLDADEMPLQEETLDWAEAVREALILFLPGMEQENIRLELQVPEQLFLIRADRTSLMRIMGNLFRNAQQHGKEGGMLGVELTESQHAYELIIRDSGPGIPEAELEQIFSRSFRGSQAAGSAKRGSGLGLAIAKSLIEKNGGSIGVQSVPWVETAFTITMPKSHPAAS
jgi:signal transduction histidine kinase